MGVDPTPGQKAPKIEPTARVKEADKITLLSFPEPPQFKGWKNHLRTAVCSASGCGNECFSWIRVVEEPGCTFDQLAISDGRASLDSKLYTALYGVAKGPARSRLTLKSEELAKAYQCLTGRQALWLIYREFSLDEARGAPGNSSANRRIDAWMRRRLLP